ncbi:MAG: EAL domain-containing protein [Burkholderiaceae bacterium]
MASRADLVGRTSLVTFEREAGRRLVQIFGRSLKTLSHIGTGRFVAVLDPDLDEMKIQSLVRTKFEGHRFVMGERHVNVRCTVGVVDVSRRSARDPDAVLAALSIAQQVAGNRADRFHLLDKSGAELNAYREQLDWIERVRAMLREGRLKIMAQPIAPSSVSAYNGLHYEILSRLVAPDGTVLAPNRFLTAISQARLLEEFDRQVITTVLSRLAEDRSLYDATRVCAINVTGPTLCDPALPQFLDLNLRRYGIDPTRIAIEITESESMTNLDQALENVAKIRDSGVLIAVDDFGTGLATFDYIRRFTPQILKIDGSFVRSLDGSALDAEIVQSIVRIGAAIGARTVAECVETPEMAIRLCELGVDYVQGWAIARPMPLEALKGFCDRRRAEIASGDGLMVAGPCMPGTNESDLTDCALAAAS